MIAEKKIFPNDILPKLNNVVWQEIFTGFKIEL